jgi:transcriptional regulator with GAF, ATPase, and Fis domain
MQQAMQTENSLARYFARGGLAYFHALEGRVIEARQFLEQAVLEGASSGLIRQYASPMVLEMLYEIEHSGLPALPELSLQRELERILTEPNIHLRGVALRLRAMDRAGKGASFESLMADLESSEELLIRSGAPIQLARTQLAMARLCLRRGDENTGRRLAQKAWMVLSGYGDEFYPDDLRHLLEVRSDPVGLLRNGQESIERFTEIIREVIPTGDLTVLLNRTVATTNRFLGAERGGIFWFDRKNRASEPVLRAACNLSQSEVASKEFSHNRDLVRQAYRENAPKLVRMSPLYSTQQGQKAMLCIPFDVEGVPRGVLYHDNSYLERCFDFLDTKQLSQISRYLSSYIAQVHSYCVRLEAAASLPRAYVDAPDHLTVLAQSPVMQAVLNQFDLVAATESTVLILGETGVGKELLAHRIHRMSPRRDHALVIVDPTTINQNLFESELFGHEKGAFTGADRQKKGRMELAHMGTLFIDEVGEIPLPMQAKLLRVLQEKKLVRVGGNQTISSDFRLVAATNRDLAGEVAAGRFRKDLYYRLNVVPLFVPPLRSRIEDVSLLARHFLTRYSAKYHRPNLGLRHEDQEKLTAYAWPGNVRELKNVMERAVILSHEDRLTLDLSSGSGSVHAAPFDDLPSIDELQRRYINFVLAKTGGLIGGPGGAAEILGMKRSTLYSRMEKLGIRQKLPLEA